MSRLSGQPIMTNELSQAFLRLGLTHQVAISWWSFATTFVGMSGAFMIASQLSLSNGMPHSMKAGTSGNARRVSFVHVIGVPRRSLGSAHLALHPSSLPKAPTRIDGPIRLM